MNSNELRELQAPLKVRYREQPELTDGRRLAIIQR